MGPVDRCRLGSPHPDLQVLECEIHCHAPVVAARTWIAQRMALRRDSTVLRWKLHALGARASHGQLQLYDIRSCKPTDWGRQESLACFEVQEAAPPRACQAERAAVRACSKASTEPQLAGARSGEQTWNAGRNDGLLHYAQPCHEVSPSAMRARTQANASNEGEMPRKAARRDALPGGKYHQATSRWC
jgi:hypothetical protein